MSDTSSVLLRIAGVSLLILLVVVTSHVFYQAKTAQVTENETSTEQDEQQGDNNKGQDKQQEGNNEDQGRQETNGESQVQHETIVSNITDNEHTLGTLHRALKYKDQQIRYARRHIDLSPPGPLLAAQVHVESRWREGVSSPVGATGLAQVMPGTAEHISELESSLEAKQILNSPLGSLQAQSVYMGYLLDRIQYRDPVNETARYAFTLCSYNGGLGWLDRERKLANDPSRWFGAVAEERERSQSAWEENRHYVRQVFKNQDYYKRLGWPGNVIEFPQ